MPRARCTEADGASPCTVRARTASRFLLGVSPSLAWPGRNGRGAWGSGTKGERLAFVPTKMREIGSRIIVMCIDMVQFVITSYSQSLLQGGRREPVKCMRTRAYHTEMANNRLRSIWAIGLPMALAAHAVALAHGKGKGRQGATCGNFTLVQNMGVVNEASLLKQVPAATTAACCAACGSTPGCSGFTFSAVRETCRMTAAPAEHGPVPNVTSGMKAVPRAPCDPVRRPPAPAPSTVPVRQN